MSLTIKGLITTVIGMGLAKGGINVADVDLTTTISTLMQIIGAIIVYIGRYRQGDITIFGNKKD